MFLIFTPNRLTGPLCTENFSQKALGGGGGDVCSRGLSNDPMAPARPFLLP